MDTDSNRQITWDTDIPLVTNGYMLRTMLKVTLGSGVLVGALVSLMLGVQGDWSLIPSILAMFFAAGMGFFAISVLIMWLVFGNHFRVRFTVGATGVRYESLDRASKVGNRAALVVGLLAGRPGAAGSGLLAMTQENQALAWSGAFRAEFDPGAHRIAFCNRWRTLMMMYCTAENYEQVRSIVTSQMATHSTAERAAGKSPLGSYLLHTTLAVLACLPLYALGDVYDYGLFLPLLLMCFAIATVWFVRHLAWVVLIAVALIVVAMLENAMSMRVSSFSLGYSYRRFEVLSGDHWALTVLAIVGMSYLLWLAISTLRAGRQPALESDLADGGEQ
jgi:hypothetical protein